MRLPCLAFLLATLAPAAAEAAEIRVVAPGFVYNSALKDLAADFTKQTGVNVIVAEDGMNVIVDHIKTATPPADVIALPADLMNTLYLDGGIVAGSYTPLGRDELGLAVKKGAPHPDIATVEKLAAALKGAGAVMVNDPKAGTMQGTIIDGILKRPDFAGVHAVPVAKGEGAAALARGEGDMAIQLVPEILNKPQIELVAPLPVALGGHMDAILAVSARAANRQDALAFVKFLTRPEARAAWQAKGLKPF
ncbi:MAG TPA: substrate-binding domain-containing protein [Rhizomicrobium sp.]|nr:substrate-binding domain-containing protein [Rhizomicrobium sp.]